MKTKGMRPEFGNCIFVLKKIVLNLEFAWDRFSKYQIRVSTGSMAMGVHVVWRSFAVLKR